MNEENKHTDSYKRMKQFFQKFDRYHDDAESTAGSELGYRESKVSPIVNEMLRTVYIYGKHPINMTNDLADIKDMDEAYLRDLSLKVCTEDMLTAINIRAVLLVARALVTLKKYRRYYRWLSREAWWLSKQNPNTDVSHLYNPYFPRVRQINTDLDVGVDIEWTKSSAFRDKVPIPRTDKGNYPRTAFNLASPTTKMIIIDEYESTFILLREQTRELAKKKKAILEYLDISYEYSNETLTSLVEIFKAGSIQWLISNNRQLSRLVSEVARFKGDFIDEKDIQSFSKFITNLEQLKYWENELDKKIIFLIRILRAIVFYRGVRQVRYYYEQNLIAIKDNWSRGRGPRTHFFLKLRASPNGISAVWMKTLKRSVSYRGQLVKDSRTLKIGDDYGYPKTAFRSPNPLVKKLICEEVEPKLALLRKQTALLGDAKRFLENIHFLNNKIIDVQEGYNHETDLR